MRAPVGLSVVFLRFGHGAVAVAELAQILPVCWVRHPAAPGYMDLMIPVGLSVLVHIVPVHFDDPFIVGLGM